MGGAEDLDKESLLNKGMGLVLLWPGSPALTLLRSIASGQGINIPMTASHPEPHWPLTADRWPPKGSLTVQAESPSSTSMLPVLYIYATEATRSRFCKSIAPYKKGKPLRISWSFEIIFQAELWEYNTANIKATHRPTNWWPEVSSSHWNKIEGPFMMHQPWTTIGKFSIYIKLVS